MFSNRASLCLPKLWKHFLCINPVPFSVFGICTVARSCSLILIPCCWAVVVTNSFHTGTIWLAESVFLSPTAVVSPQTSFHHSHVPSSPIYTISTVDCTQLTATGLRVCTYTEVAVCFYLTHIKIANYCIPSGRASATCLTRSLLFFVGGAGYESGFYWCSLFGWACSVLLLSLCSFYQSFWLSLYCQR